MLKFFAGLTGIGVIMSQPMLLVGVFMVFCVLAAAGGAFIGGDAGWTLLFSIVALVLAWTAPVAAVIASLVQDEKVIQRRHNSSYAAEVARNTEKNRVWGALGAFVLGVFIPSFVVMLLSGFTLEAACARGDETAGLAFLYNPIAMILKAISPLMGIPGPAGVCL